MSDALGLFNRDPGRDDSSVRDYLFFCVERCDAWPPLPCTVARMTRFLFFIQRARRLGGGWRQQGLGVWSARTAAYPGKVYDRDFSRGAIQA
eukprot:SAG31_NODE_17888_length_654_cov_2.003604_2_plen_91_part_01